ncbi:MAG: FtsX-like permease family protein [Rubrivivax sp.]|nr:FtsX-like permease family protein [Rubrivivax sp.]
MRDTRAALVWRDIAEHRARSALVVLALSLALAAAGTLLDTWALVRRATHEGYAASRPASATLRLERTAQLDPRAVQRLQARPEIAAWRTRRVSTVAVQGAGAWRAAQLIVVDDFAADAIGRLLPDTGPWPPPDGALVVERSSREYSGLVPGDAVRLRAGDIETASVPLGGVLRDVAQAPGWMEHVVTLYATPATLQRLGLPAGIDELQFRVADDTATREQVRRVAAAVQADLEAAGHRVRDVDVPVPGEHVHAAQMSSLMLAQGVFALLALAVCALLVVNLYAALLAGHARRIGVLKTLGASVAVLHRQYAALALLLGAAATALAVPAAWALGRRYAAYKAELLNFPIETLALPAWPVALQLAVGLLLPLAAALLPVRRACAQPVGALLRDAGLGAADAVPRLPRLPERLPRLVQLALTNPLRRPRRTALTVLALALGGAVQIGADNLRTAVRGSVDALYAGQRHAITLRLASPQPVAALEALAQAEPGVTRAEAWRVQRAVVRGDDGALGERLTLVGVPPSTQQLRPALVDGRWLRDDGVRAEPMPVVVGGTLARNEAAYATGREFTLVIDGRPRRVVVVGRLDGPPQPVAYASRAARVAAAGADPDDAPAATLTIATDAATLPAQLELVQRLRAALADAGMPVATSTLLAEARRVTEDHLLMVVDFLGAMGWVMLAVGAIGLLSSMGLAVLERRRELAVMRAIGAPHGALLRLVLAEGLVVSLAAWLAALPLSVPLAAGLAVAFGRVMFPVPVPWLPEPAAALRWLVVLLAVSLVASAGPAWRASRVPVARSLGYE